MFNEKQFMFMLVVEIIRHWKTLFTHITQRTIWALTITKINEIALKLYTNIYLIGTKMYEYLKQKVRSLVHGSFVINN